MISCLVLVDTATKTLYIAPLCYIPEDSATQMVGNPESLKPDSGLGTQSLSLNNLQEDVFLDNRLEMEFGHTWAYCFVKLNVSI